MAKDKTPKGELEPQSEQKTTAQLQSFLNKDDEDREPQDRIGRKPVPINWDKVETAMALGCDLKSCAMFGGVHWNTLERRIIERYGEGFREVRASFLTDFKVSALVALRKKVKEGDTKAILFANRALNGMNDRPKDAEEDDSGEMSTFRVAYNLDTPPEVIEAQFKELESKNE